jgi:hypothetical protein
VVRYSVYRMLSLSSMLQQVKVQIRHEALRFSHQPANATLNTVSTMIQTNPFPIMH